MIEQSEKAIIGLVVISRQLHYLLSQITTDSARLSVRSEWETLKNRYGRLTGTTLPDTILVATLLNKTAGPLQQHLRLNVRTLDTYENVKSVILA